MTELLILTTSITLFLFVVLTVKVCKYRLGEVYVTRSRSRRSRYLRLMHKAARIYLYSWIVAGCGIAAVILLVIFGQRPAAANTETAVVGLLVTTSFVTMAAVVWGEILLARAELMRGGRSYHGLSENSITAR
jgi:hypothetical protein